MIAFWVVLALVAAGGFFSLGWSLAVASHTAAREASAQALAMARQEAAIGAGVSDLAGGLGEMNARLDKVRERVLAMDASVAQIFNAMTALGMFERERGVRPNRLRVNEATGTPRAPDLGRDEGVAPDESLIS